MTMAPQSVLQPSMAASDLDVDAPAKTTLAQRLDRASEWLNPILVKESRQALKSRQFVITFTIMLIVTWISTIIAVTSLWPTIYYLPYGTTLLATYSIILAVPLIVVVPFSAFRSLAVEREDGTFELVSVTALSARQIVTGKLGSAFAQIMVYCSAIAPCLVFTYLLRGVDLVRILFVIAWTIGISGALCCVALLAATFSRARYMQSLLSVGLLLILLAIGWTWLYMLAYITLAGESISWGLYAFWATMGYMAMVLVCLSVTSVLASAAQISFASDNHATPVRISLFFTQALATGGFVYLSCLYDDVMPMLIASIFCCIFWAFAGSLLLGDSGFVSERVRRQLPASLFGRALFSWFNPGSGTAYVFACVTLASGVLSAMIFGVVATEEGLFGITRNNWFTDFRLVTAVCLAVMYVVAYLGASNLILAALRLYVPLSPVISFVVTSFVAFSACLIPLMVAIALDTNLVPSYDAIQAPNWAWTITECLDSGIDEHIVLIVSLYTVPIFFINVLMAYREVAATKMAVPARVLEENRLLRPEAPVKPQPLSPWDEEPAANFPESAH